MKKRKSIPSRLDRILSMPDEISSNRPKITIVGFEQVFIENYIGIININGFNLKLEEMTNDDLLVTGRIEGMDFESIENEED